MRIEAKCIEKLRGKGNKIVAYRIQDQDFQVRTISSLKLKILMRAGKIHMLNLKLTSDNRLIDSIELPKNLQVNGGTSSRPVTESRPKGLHPGRLDDELDMRKVFEGCRVLKRDKGIEDDIDKIFSRCGKVKVDLSKFDTADLTDMRELYYNNNKINKPNK